MHAVRAGAGVILLLSAGSGAAASGDRRLPDAAKLRDADAVQQLLAGGAEVDARHADGATALHWSVHWNDAETVARLLRGGADPNARNELGVTPISLAAVNGHAGIASALLEAGADVNLPLPTGETPLMTAARTGRTELVSLLLARGADVAARERQLGQTALMWAIAEQHSAVVRLLLDSGADPRARTTSGFMPLLFAARTGNLAIGTQLLAAGATAGDASKDGATALLVATVRAHVPFALMMLEHGADPNATGTGYGALHWAAGSWETELSGPRGIRVERDEEWKGVRGLGERRLELVRALLAHGADPNLAIVKAPPRTGFTVFRSRLVGATPLFIAAVAGDAAVMQTLADAGADPRRTLDDGTTPLMAACGVGRVLAESRLRPDASVEAAKLAWQLGNDVNAVNAAGETALHGAAHIRSDTLVRFLADRGAALDVKNRRGETPLYIAERTFAAGSAPVFMRTTTGDLLRSLGASASDDGR